jgi:hypothetical protein
VKSDLPYSLYATEKDSTVRRLNTTGKKWQELVDPENGVLPFLSFPNNSEAVDAEQNLDIFTQEVLIPLCVKTNAIVICTPTRACSLGMSFAKAANFLASKYRYPAPLDV